MKGSESVSLFSFVIFQAGNIFIPENVEKDAIGCLSNRILMGDGGLSLISMD